LGWLAEIIKDFGPPVAWIVAIAGLIYNNRMANDREKRKEFRSEIDAIEKVTKDVVSKLTSYYKLFERDDSARTLEIEIKVLFREIDLKWDRLSRRQSGGALGLLVDPCNVRLEELYDHSTGKFFETTDRIPADQRNEFIQEIHVRALLYMEALHSLFLKKFDGI
jgi:hypothetical protein